MKKIFAVVVLLLVIVAAAYAAENPYTMKSGMYYSEQWGLYIANVIEKDGEIYSVIIDRLDKQGRSSKELHDNYGIKRVSTINKDWWEQTAYFENWLKDNGLDALKTDDTGHALNVDLISGATINVEELARAVREALGK